jgi:RNA polymerase sigma-70 factor (ECF subfamily)
MPDRRARFEALVREVAEPLHRYAVRRVGPDRAPDVVADAFLVMWRRLDDVPETGALPWCYAVTRLCVSNAERTQRRQRGLVARIARLDPPVAQLTADDGEPDVELHDALRRLPESQRELLRLWAWESLTPAEIAVVLGITPNAVSIRLHRARKRLADELPPGRRKAPDPPGHEEVLERRTP